MYLGASVRCLASPAVIRQGIFALATDGVEGAVLMAWYSSDSEANRLYRRTQYADFQHLLALRGLPFRDGPSPSASIW
ncbi:uncharacterized protein BT62DRAFT_1055486 [Guyanagaster necrorhizus]|uniref:Uncharacterized protein n=1 Tax=Guyanagaster necrorhizus TaxID=856835 RepID=A0A9P7VGJ9_9AGAR|nr:uncharacterized protein BT62DRAFT_1055486 [Guyanagaster necrorhizus MCA 3950]KAG7439589.1 hypothetical protein BT62DRAFT_1055486 [Guyanagaster necrorhizus MCA 3950]